MALEIVGALTAISSSSENFHMLLKLPACERCRLRKVKCDTSPPKCGPCKRNATACIIVDPVSRERYTRDGIFQLEQTLKLLEQNTHGAASTSPVKSPSSQSTMKGARTHFVGEGSGLQFFKQLSSHTTTDVPLTEGSSFPRNTLPSSAAVAPHKLPPPDVAQLLVNHYLSHVQLHHPLLAERDVVDTLQRVYSAVEHSISPDDLYRLYMIFAIASVTTYRRGKTQHHPYRYFRAAQRYSLQVSFLGDIRGIQNALLIARFSMYYHVDCSIWDLARFCVRQCVALELHRPPATSLLPLEEQLQRNIFWDCYIHDRYSSGILGRPYAIAEADVTVELPVERSEDELANLSSLREDCCAGKAYPPNKASVFCFVIQLRRLLTRISNCFYTTSGHATSPRRGLAHAAKVKTDLDRFLQELDDLRANAPAFAEPGSLYERPEWYDFLVEKDKLTLIRGAIAQVPVDRLQPPHKLLLSSMLCATRVLSLYNAMFSAGHITWTRSYFQIMFTSGLSVMYTMSVLKPEKTGLQTDSDNLFAQAAHTLIATADLMKAFVSEMPDAGRFAMVFDVLVKHYTGSGTRARPSRCISPQQEAAVPSINHSRRSPGNDAVEQSSLAFPPASSGAQEQSVVSCPDSNPWANPMRPSGWT